MQNSIVGFVKRWWHYAIGFVIIVYLLSKVDIGAIVSAFSSADITLAIAAFLLIIPMFIVKAVRWQYIMKKQGISYGLWDCVSMYFAAMFLGFVTPGRVAELLKASYLTNDGHSLGKSFFSVFFDRLADLLFLVVIGYFGLFFFKGIFGQQIVWLGFLMAAGIVAVFAVVIKRELAKSIVKGLLGRIIPKSRNVDGSVEDFFGSVKLFGFESTVVVMVLTLLSMVFYYLVAILFAKSLGIDVPYYYVIISMSVAALVAILPVSIAGVGTRDVTLLLMLGQLGVAKETIIAYSTFNLLATLFLIACCAPFWFKRPFRLMPGS